MKRTLGIFFGALLTLAFFSTSAEAQKSKRLNINERQRNQQERIFRGVKSGELTGRETGRLIREQAQINRMETRFRANGDGLSRRERARLQYEQSQASWHIYRQKHDRQDYPRP